VRAPQSKAAQTRSLSASDQRSRITTSKRHIESLGASGGHAGMYARREERSLKHTPPLNRSKHLACRAQVMRAVRRCERQTCILFALFQKITHFFIGGQKTATPHQTTAACQHLSDEQRLLTLVHLKRTVGRAAQRVTEERTEQGAIGGRL
jgi:hypothetical protein